MALLKDRHGRIPLGLGGEFDLIRKLLGGERALGPHVLVGPGDDCVVLAGGLVVSTDLAVEGVHFNRAWVTLREAGYRAAAGALSDLAAMAAEPVGLLLSMALDPATAASEAVELQGGVEEACRMEGIEVLGGDLSRSPGPLMLCSVVVGHTETPVLRAGTQVGDEVWVSGRLGASAGAVWMWNQGRTPSPALRETFVRPRPRIREALWLLKRAPIHGLVDLSDGLVGDSGHLAAASGLSIVLEEGSVPVHPALFDLPGYPEEPLQLALKGGEDFELCLTAPPETLDDLAPSFQDSFGIPLTRVGWALEGEGVSLSAADGQMKPMEAGGFNHFSGEGEG